MARRLPLTLLDRNRIVREAVETMPGPVAERLLVALMAPPADRARLIGEFHREAATRSFAELLIDFEEDGQLALDFAQALKDQVRRA